jgi:hypothetical protein
MKRKVPNEAAERCCISRSFDYKTITVLLRVVPKRLAVTMT